MTAAVRALEWLGRIDAESPLAERWHGRLVAATAVVAVGAQAILVPVWLVLGTPGDALVGVLSATGGVLMLALWRRLHRLAPVLFLLLGWYLALFAGAAVIMRATAYLAWLSALPLVMFFAGGRRMGVVATVVTIVGLLVAAGLLHDVAIAESTGFAPLLRLLSLPPVLAALGFLAESSRLRGISELEGARLQVQEQAATRTRMLAHVSHEIRTPLNGILGMTQALLSRTIPGDVREDLEVVRESGTGLVALISDLLDLTRAEVGKLELHEAPTELFRLARSVAALYRPAADLKGVELAIAGASSGEMWVNTDEVRLRQVLGNLVANAVKFTDAGIVSVVVSTAPSGSDAVEVLLSVEDSGRGMSAERVARLFQPFSQVHDDATKGGSGLGLAISRELASRLGGTLDVTSTEGAGSVFSLRLRLPIAARPDPRTAPAELKRFSALVVDDNALNRRVARALLERLGGTVSEASNGESGVDAALLAPCDVVLMDLHMTNLDGLAATRLLRARGFDGAVVGLTGDETERSENDWVSAGANALLSKPVQFERLRAIVGSVLLNSARAQDEDSSVGVAEQRLHSQRASLQGG